MRSKALRGALVAIELFMGVNAVGGGLALMFGWFPSSWLPVSWLRGSPFRSYFIPGLFLATIIGAGNLLSAAWVLMRNALGAPASVVVGLVGAAWILAQTAIIGLRMWIQPLIFVLSLITAGLGARLWQRAGESAYPAQRAAGSPSC